MGAEDPGRLLQLHRAPVRWGTRFGRWVSRYGAARLAQSLGSRGDPVTVSAVHKWLAGESLPRPSRAIAIVEIAGGSISLRDLYQHGAQVRTTSTPSDDPR